MTLNKRALLISCLCIGIVGCGGGGSDVDEVDISKIAPTISVADTLEVDAEDENGISVDNDLIQDFFESIAISDNIDSSLSPVIDAPDFLSIGGNSISISATDSDGNTTTITVTIQVNDVTSPVFGQFQLDWLVDANTENGYTDTSTLSETILNSVVATDNHSRVSFQLALSGTLGFGNHAVSVLARDEAGNEANITINIFVDEYHGTFLEPGSNWVAVCGFIADVNEDIADCELKKFSNYGYDRLTSYTVNNTNILHVNESSRAIELESASMEQMRQICNIDMFIDRDHPFDFDRFEDTNSDEFSNAISDLAVYMIGQRLNAIYYQDQSALSAMLQNFLNVANTADLADADMVDGPQHVNMRYAFQTIVMGWHSLKNNYQVSAQDKQTIEGFLEDWAQALYVSAAYALGRDQPTMLEQANMGWMQDMGLMMWGITNNNNEYFQRGVSRYFMILDKQIRSDGSIVQESQRGADALGYSTSSLGYLIMLAEIGFRQGYDLYEVEIDGKSIRTVIDFHLRAYEDNELYHQYTIHQNPAFGSPEQLANWNNQNYENFDLSTNQFLFSALEVFKARFPNDALTTLAKDMFPEEEYFGFYELASGGQHTCDFRPIN